MVHYRIPNAITKVEGLSRPCQWAYLDGSIVRGKLQGLDEYVKLNLDEFVPKRIPEFDLRGEQYPVMSRDLMKQNFQKWLLSRHNYFSSLPTLSERQKEEWTYLYRVVTSEEQIDAELPKWVKANHDALYQYYQEIPEPMLNLLGVLLTPWTTTKDIHPRISKLYPGIDISCKPNQLGRGWIVSDAKGNNRSVEWLLRTVDLAPERVDT